MEGAVITGGENGGMESEGGDGIVEGRSAVTRPDGTDGGVAG